MRVNAIIVAGGSGRRIGGSLPKQFLEVRGVPLIRRVASAIGHLQALTRVVIVARKEHWRLCRTHVAGVVPVDLVFAAAGPERQDSVASGLRVVEEECDIVVVHDAARPFVTAGLLSRCLAGACECGAAFAALRATDTVKEVGEDGIVARTLDRPAIWLAQTPQAFRKELLVKAHERARRDGVRATDDAALVERLGVPVRAIEGEESNIKITTRLDLALAEAIAALRDGS